MLGERTKQCEKKSQKIYIKKSVTHTVPIICAISKKFITHKKKIQSSVHTYPVRYYFLRVPTFFFLASQFIIVTSKKNII